MFKLIIAASLVALATSCCYPKQWEATVSFQSGSWDGKNKNGSSYEGYATMSSDGVNNISAYNQHLIVDGNVNISQTLVLDYNQRVMFIVDSKGVCDRYELGEPVPQCFSDDDPSSQIFRYGFGANLVKARSFTYSQNGTTNYLMVDADNCAPLTYNTVVMSPGFYQTTSSVFTGVKLGIPDRRVFNVPVSCANTNSPIKPQVSGLGKRRSVIF